MYEPIENGIWAYVLVRDAAQQNERMQQTKLDRCNNMQYDIVLYDKCAKYTESKHIQIKNTERN